MSSIDGIVSGINTKDFIANMIKLESAPQTLLQNKKATTDAITKALQAINTKVASLAEFAAKAKKPESLNAVAATVSDSKMAAVTTTESAKPGSLSFTVDQVATSQSSLVKLPDSMGASPSFTLTRDGKDVTITAVTNSLPDIVDAFNAEGTGVKATLITVDDENGAQTQLLQLTSIEQPLIPGQWAAGADINELHLEVKKDFDHIGGIQAWDINKGKEVWREKYKHSWNWGSIMTTASGVLFAGGTNDRMFHAYDAKTGKLLWQFPTPSGIISPPSSFSIAIT